MTHDRGFLASLFDLSFTSFIITKLIKTIFVFQIISNAIIALLTIGAGFNRGFFTGVMTLFIGAPLLFLLLTILGRIVLEVAIAFIRNVELAAQISENTARSARVLEDQHAPTP